MYTFSFSVDLTVNWLILPFDTGPDKMLQKFLKKFIAIFYGQDIINMVRCLSKYPRQTPGLFSE